MYKICQTKQSAERQRHIVDCLFEMLKSIPFQDVTAQALCQKSEVPRKTFYRYFDGKEDVFDVMVDYIMLDYERFPGPYREGERRTSEKDMEKMFLFWHEHDDFLTAVSRSGLSGRFIERSIYTSFQEKLGMTMVAQQESLDWFRITTCFSMCGLFALIWDWRRRGYPQTPQEMAHIAVKLLTQPLYRSLP